MKPVTTYKEMVIEQDDQWRFYVPDMERTFDSLVEARAAIDKHADRILKAKRTKLSLAVIDSEGASRTVTGIHASQKTILMTPVGDRASYTEYYPETPATTALVKRLRKAESEMQKCKAALRPFRISYRNDHGSVDILAADYAKLRELAEKTDPDKAFDDAQTRIRF